MPKVRQVLREDSNQPCRSCPAGLACTAGIARYTWGADVDYIAEGYGDDAIIVHVGDMSVGVISGKVLSCEDRILVRLTKEDAKRCPLRKQWTLHATLPTHIREWLNDA